MNEQNNNNQSIFLNLLPLILKILLDINLYLTTNKVMNFKKLYIKSVREIKDKIESNISSKSVFKRFVS
jgi:hypothetical protein